jgi:hypothetical protein
MPIQDTNDEGLRLLIFDYPKAIVKFTKKDCVVCERMGKTYQLLSEQKEYNNILFLRMDASENPVSSQEVHLSGTPFFAIYRKGKLEECRLISDAEELKEMLDQLQKD